MNKRIVYFDMDNVLADFQSGVNNIPVNLRQAYLNREDEFPHIFAQMKPLPGAIEAVNRISKKYDVHVLSTVPYGSMDGASDKLSWLRKHFGNIFKKKVTFTHRKDMVVGYALIDDNLAKNGAGFFSGRRLWLRECTAAGCTEESIHKAHVPEGYEECATWNDVFEALEC